MTPEQWTMISKGLDKISELCETTVPALTTEIALINRDIQGNGSKGLKTFIQELACEVKTLQSITIPALEKSFNKKKPRYSWPQVIVMCSIVVAGVTFMKGFDFVTAMDLSAKLVRLEQKIDDHIAKP